MTMSAVTAVFLADREVSLNLPIIPSKRTAGNDDRDRVVLYQYVEEVFS